MDSTIANTIEDCDYLLEFQKRLLLKDLEGLTGFEMEDLEAVFDRVFRGLFGKGWHDLTTVEQTDIRWCVRKG